ncbi:MAG TPA: hypothetical protein VE988_13345 [Gemmataceae bacterium]|nr:hypothetical protein [Gemmataceae bacterium]
MIEAPIFNATNLNGFMDHATVRHVRFAAQANGDDTVLMTFADPTPSKALIGAARLNGQLAEPGRPDVLDVLTVPLPPQDNPSLREQLSNWVGASAVSGLAAPIGTVFHGAHLFWRPGRAAILAAPERMDLLLLALVDFGYYENELRKLEQEIAEAWPELEADSHLAHEVTRADLERRELVGRRMGQTLQRRMRFARLEPHLLQAPAHLSLQAQELGTRLREKSRVEERLAAVERQLELFGHTYETASQKMADFRAGSQERKLELMIVVLLAAETLLLLMSLLWTM